MNVKDELTLKAAALAHAGYGQWSDFLAAFAAYTNEKKDECLAAPVADLQVAQGRAQQCKLLEDLLKGAVARADKLKQ